MAGRGPQPAGLLARFGDPEALLAAARAAREAGFRGLRAFSPFAVEGLAEALGEKPSRLPWVILAGGVAGGTFGYGMQAYAAIWDYPLRVAGRPFHSWPAFIPATFELTVLGAGLTALFAMLLRNGLPRPHHPLFAVPGFERATRDGFFLYVPWDPTAPPLLRAFGAMEVRDVEG